MMFSRLIATIFHFGQAVPGKNSPQLWIDSTRCPFVKGNRRLCVGRPRLSINKRVRDYMKNLHAQARICVGPRKPTEKLVRMDGTLYVGDIVKRDALGMLESICDALEKVVYDDDFQIHELHIYRRLDRDQPRIEMEFHEIEDPDFDEARAKAAHNRQKAADRKDGKKAGQEQLGLLSSPRMTKGSPEMQLESTFGRTGTRHKA